MNSLKKIISKIKKKLNYLKNLIILSINIFYPKQKTNLGSGIRNWIGWNLFDSIEHQNISLIEFTTFTRIPLKDSSQKLVYSSHFFEHISETVVTHLLEECHRVMKHNGMLLIKLPDYDILLQEFLSGNFKIAKMYGLDKVASNWTKFNLENNYENWISMIFAGFYSRNYGEHFKSRNSVDLINGFHGPARIHSTKLHDIFNQKSPQVIARDLAQIITKDPIFYRFNHQSAWSEMEFVNLAVQASFKRIEINNNLEKKLRKIIPDFDNMKYLSKYYLFCKTTNNILSKY
jgi:hypothetical protein